MASGSTAPPAIAPRKPSLYTIEAEVRGQSPAHRLAARRARSRPLIDAMHVWLVSELPRLPARGALAGAIRYALTRWDGLTRFLTDGRVDLDTNPVERAIRPITWGARTTSSLAAMAAASAGQ